MTFDPECQHGPPLDGLLPWRARTFTRASPGLAASQNTCGAGLECLKQSRFSVRKLDPFGLHPVTVREIKGTRVKTGPTGDCHGFGIVMAQAVPTVRALHGESSTGLAVCCACDTRAGGACHFHVISSCRHSTACRWSISSQRRCVPTDDHARPSRVV